MDRVNLIKKGAELLRKYRFALLILAIGAVLLLWPSGGGKASEGVQLTETQQQSITQELTQILGQIQGVGKVKVMLSIEAGQETVYQYDEENHLGDNASERKQTVTVTDKDRNESGLIRQVIPAQYLGALVVCEGAEQASVRFAVVEAVSRITGLGADRISVQKMK
jgi:stage III sporulation protein AG